MGAFDLPFDELKAYRPEREEPSDFDRFWAIALDEAGALRTASDVRASHPELRALEEFDVTFSGYRGQPIKAWLILPRRPRGRRRGTRTGEVSVLGGSRSRPERGTVKGAAP